MSPNSEPGPLQPRRKDKLHQRPLDEPNPAPLAQPDALPEDSAPEHIGHIAGGTSLSDPDDARLSWLDDGPIPEGWKPQVFRAKLRVRPPTRALATTAEAVLLAAAFLVCASLALLALGWMGTQLQPGSVEVRAFGVLVRHQLAVALASGSLAALLAWRVTGRRRRALAKHLGVGYVGGREGDRGHTGR